MTWKLRLRNDHDAMMTSTLTCGRKSSFSFWCFINWASVGSGFINFVPFSRDQKNNWNRIIKDLRIWLVNRTRFSKKFSYFQSETGQLPATLTYPTWHLPWKDHLYKPHHLASRQLLLNLLVIHAWLRLNDSPESSFVVISNLNAIKSIGILYFRA